MISVPRAIIKMPFALVKIPWAMSNVPWTKFLTLVKVSCAKIYMFEFRSEKGRSKDCWLWLEEDSFG